MRKMIQFSDVNIIKRGFYDIENGKDVEEITNYNIPDHVEVFEITGPLFFGAAYKFKEAMKFIEKAPKILIIRMSRVPIIDATGIKTIKEVYRESKHRGTKLILSEVHSGQVMQELKNARLLFAIGKSNVTNTLPEAIERANTILNGI
jgi:SulP family sulfate permease